MLDLIFASNNDHKAAEIQAVSGNSFRIVTLKQAGIHVDIPEPHDTLEANANEKSETILKLTGKNCFSEDTGLEVNALNGEPGVKSARYADNENQFKTNTEKLLFKLKNVSERAAQFRTVISLKLNNGEFFFEGICEGNIAASPKGTNGFGYDAVFIPLGSDQTFGEMTLESKSIFSHRKKAIDKMVAFLQQLLPDKQSSINTRS